MYLLVVSAIDYLLLRRCDQRIIKQETQLMLTNPRDAFKGQSGSPNSTIPYVRYVSTCAIVTLSLRRAVFRYSTSKNVVTVTSGSEVTQGS